LPLQRADAFARRAAHARGTDGLIDEHTTLLAHVAVGFVRHDAFAESERDWQGARINIFGRRYTRAQTERRAAALKCGRSCCCMFYETVPDQFDAFTFPAAPAIEHHHGRGRSGGEQLVAYGASAALFWFRNCSADAGNPADTNRAF
jgi:hypothetical protein